MKFISTKNAIGATKNLKEFGSNKSAALDCLHRKLATKSLIGTILQKWHMETSSKKKHKKNRPLCIPSFLLKTLKIN